MPKFLEQKLKAEAAKQGLTGRSADHYVYGAMNNNGTMRGNKETAKGAREQAKHVSDAHLKRQVRAAVKTRYGR